MSNVFLRHVGVSDVCWERWCRFTELINTELDSISLSLHLSQLSVTYTIIILIDKHHIYNSWDNSNQIQLKFLENFAAGRAKPTWSGTAP